MKDMNVLIVGAGTMGRGLAQVFSTKGISTTIYDAFPEALETAKEKVLEDLMTMKNDGIVTEEEIQLAEKNLNVEADLEVCGPWADIAIECVYENPYAKKQVFQALDQYCKSDCIFCSNTSGSNIFEMVDISHPQRLVITHFFNPAILMPLVEIVGDKDTSQDTIDYLKDVFTYVGKEVAVLKQYVPGFIVNRIATAIAREAAYMIDQGWANGEDIDLAISKTSGIRYAFEGPLALYDVVGWDLTTEVSEDIQKTLCNDAGKNRLGEKFIKDGTLGLKSGKGVYDYSNTNPGEYMEERSRRIVKMIQAINSCCESNSKEHVTSV